MTRDRAIETAVLVAKAVVIGFAIFNVIEAVKVPFGNDAAAYWNAAERLRHGQMLYPALTTAAQPDAYRYAPWLAWLWVPLTYLPHQAVLVGWSAILFLASGSVVVALARLRAWLPLLLLGPIFIDTSLSGNIHPIILAGLLFSLEGSWGPLWVALASSLKAAPIVLTGVYLGRRQWAALALTIGLTVLLVAPMLLYDLGQYGTTLTGTAGRFGLPLWLAGCIVAVLVVLTPFSARTRYRWLVPSAAMIVALPYANPYNLQLAYLGLAPLVHQARSRRSEAANSAPIGRRQADVGAG